MLMINWLMEMTWNGETQKSTVHTRDHEQNLLQYKRSN